MEKQFAFANIAVVLALVLALNGSDNFSANNSTLPNIINDSLNIANDSQNAAEETQETAPPELGKTPGPKSMESNFELGRAGNNSLPADWLSGDFDAEEKDSSCFRCNNEIWGAGAVKLDKDAPMKSCLKFETIGINSYLKKIINNPLRGVYTFEFKVKITSPFKGCASNGCTNSFMFEVSSWWWQGDIWQAVSNWPIYFNENGAYLYGEEQGLVEADVGFEDAGDGWKKVTVKTDISKMDPSVQKLGIYFGNADAEEGSFLLDDFTMEVKGI